MLRDNRRFDFTIIENDIIDDIDRFDKNDLLCYMALCRFANNDTAQCYPSYKTIAEKMRVSESIAIRAVKSLISKGVLVVEKRKNEKGGDTSNLYTIVNIQKDNKKADTGKVSTTQKSKKSNFDNSIPQDIEISKEENIKSEAINLINKSSVSIKKADLKDCEEEFKDIDRLALALVYCEGKEQNGIKALRLAYKNELWNKKDNSNSVKTRFHNINNRTQQYSAEELEKLILENQKDRFKDIDNTVKKIQNGEIDTSFNPNF